MCSTFGCQNRAPAVPVRKQKRLRLSEVQLFSGVWRLWYHWHFLCLQSNGDVDRNTDHNGCTRYVFWNAEIKDSYAFTGSLGLRFGPKVWHMCWVGHCQCRCVGLYTASPVNRPLSPSYTSTMLTKMSLTGASEQLQWRLVWAHGPRDCSRRTDHQWQKTGGRTCWIGDVICAVDFAPWNGVVWLDNGIQCTVNFWFQHSPPVLSPHVQCFRAR